jgi:hypothetical protein
MTTDSRIGFMMEAEARIPHRIRKILAKPTR